MEYKAVDMVIELYERLVEEKRRENSSVERE